VKYFGEMWSFAKQNGFQVYICQLDLDVQTCSKRNIHGRSEADIEKCVSGWEATPSHHPVLDATSLLQSASIPEVEMEEVNSPESDVNENDDGSEVR
jgi:YLP motif-containing protein 1